MKIFRVIRNLQNKSYFRKYFNNYTYFILGKETPTEHYIPNTLKYYNCRRYSIENEDESDDYPLLETETFDQAEKTKYIVFKNSDNKFVQQLNGCSSVTDVWDIFKKYKNRIDERQITQIILVLHDLRTVYCKKYCSVDSVRLNFLNELKCTHFSSLLDVIVNQLDTFNSEFLSYVFLYLHKLGIHTQDYPMMMIAEKLQKDLLKDFNLVICSRWMKVIFLENGIRPYYMSLDLIPKVLQAIDECDSVDDLASISTCLSKLQNIVTPDVSSKFANKVEDFLEKRKFINSNPTTILKILMALSCGPWKDEYTILISKCMLLLKNEINRLDTPHLLLLYEIFFKIQEPGELLNEIQRSAAKFWQQHEENEYLDVNTALKLFSSLIYFNSPLHRIHLRKDVDRLLKDNMSPTNLVLLRKIFSYVKISDKNICRKYWDMWCKALEDDENIFLIVKACQNYMQFNIDVDNYRHHKFEQQALEMVKNLFRHNEPVSGSNLGTLLTFVIFYSKDEVLLQCLINKLKDNPISLNSKDCLFLSKAFYADSGCCSEKHSAEIKNALNEASQYILSLNDNRYEQIVFLLKAALMRNDYDNYRTDCLMTELKQMEYMSSKFLENISYIFLNSNTLIPEVFNKVTEYILNNSNNIVGFNAEKVLFLCFHLAYVPINADRFFQAVTDIIIRDQERLSGLAFIQSALSLSFFNKLPSFLVKQIFNVEFMDRLDNELAHCYSKEKYPQRVRQTLMYLNRTVCLEYPEFNVPWFHEKYIQDIQKRFVTELDYNYTRSIKEYLVEIAGNKIIENFITPYGYHIDFIVNLNKDKCIVPSTSQSISKRVALLLVRHYAFTRLYAHLKGTYQMKIRHLEIMGYSVSVLKIDDWTNLLYASERIEYLSKLIWPENWETIRCTVKR